MRRIAIMLILLASAAVCRGETIGQACTYMERVSMGDAIWYRVTDTGMVTCAVMFDAFRGHKWFVALDGRQVGPWSAEALAIDFVKRQEYVAPKTPRK